MPFSIYCSHLSLACNFDWVARAGRPAQERVLNELWAAGATLHRETIAAADFRSDPARRCRSS